MATAPSTDTPIAFAPPAVPPLTDGGQLDAAEFWRRYVATAEDVKAELIDGEVVMASPGTGFHGRPHGRLYGWLDRYAEATPATEPSIDTTVRIDRDNTPQPDACLICLPPRVSQASEDADGYLVGVPDLVIEVANATVRRDLGPKRCTYERLGVRELIIWQVRDGVLDWLTRDGNRLVPLLADADGISRRQAFPGLWLDVAALLRHDRAGVTAALVAGLASADHAAFAAAGRDEGPR